MKKRGATEYEDIEFEIGAETPAAYLNWGLKKISCRAYLLFVIIF